MEKSKIKNSQGEFSLIMLALKEHFKIGQMDVYFHKKPCLKTQISLKAILTGFFMDRVKFS